VKSFSCRPVCVAWSITNASYMGARKWRYRPWPHETAARLAALFDSRWAWPSPSYCPASLAKGDTVIHSTLSLAAIGCHSLGIYTVISLS
jgi:hypothetical protein